MNLQLPVLSPPAVEHRHFPLVRPRVFSQTTLHNLGASILSMAALVLLHMIDNYVCIDTSNPALNGR